jgi:hypothetical protein
MQVFGVFTALPNLPFLCTKVTRLSGHGSGIEPQENNSKALQVSNIRWLLFHQDRQVMASTVACRASSPQLGSWLDRRWKIPCSTTGTVSRPEHIFIVLEPRVRHAGYLSSSAVSRPEKKRLGLRKKSYLCCVPKQLDFGVLKLAPSACWRGLAQPTLQ